MLGLHGGLILSLALTGCGEISGKGSSGKTVGPASDIGPVGRYTIIHSPLLERDTVLIDTATGKTWSQVVYKNHEGEPVVWQPMAREDNQYEMTNIIGFDHPPKDKR
jgi:hypothetical protein